MHHLVVWLLKLNLSPKELELAVALGLDAVDLLLLSSFPYLVKVLQELVH